MLKSFVAELSQHEIGEVYFNHILAPYTTWKIGGPADVLIVPQTLKQLTTLVQLLQKHSLSWTNLGRGSNLLVSDRGIRGVVIQLGSAFDYVRFHGSTVEAGGAYSLIKLAIMSGKEGLSGFEFAGGIPASVGGAVYMNAGAHGSEIAHVFKSAQVLLTNGSIVEYGREEMHFTYRHSILHENPGIVLNATFELQPGDRQQIATALASNKERRLRTQPLQLPCAGSVFRNPQGDFAARLIEQCGYKGYQLGGAQVSPQHANFIINTGNATALDVLQLIAQIQTTVKEKHSIELVPEVMVLGEQ